MGQFERDTGLLIDKLERWIEGFIRLTPNLVVAGIVLVLFWLLGRWLSRLALRTATRRDRENLGEVLGALIRWVTVILGIMVGVTIVAPSISPGDLFGFLGIGSVAIGFAFKDILQNLLAGILLLIRQPFNIGDQITSGGHEGVVERIETRATLIRTYDNRRVVIPNADIYTDSVVVETAFETARSNYDVTIGADDDMAEAARIMVETMRALPEVLDEPGPAAVPWSMDADGMTIRMFWWTASPRADIVRARGAVIRHVAGALMAAGIDLPYPQRYIHVATSGAAAGSDRSPAGPSADGA